MEMSTAFEDVQKTRVAYEKPEVPDAFHGYVKEQMRNMYCDFTTVVGDTNLSLLSDSAVTQKVKQMGNTLRSMTVSTGC